MKLKSLEEFNQQRRDFYNLNFKADDTPKPNGIACPSCGQELLDSEPNITLASNPPKKNIHCQWCGLKGYRIA